MPGLLEGKETMRKARLCFLVVILGLCVSSAAQSSPTIVAQVDLTNQTSQIPVTELVTPTNDALYRVSVYLEVPSRNPTGGQWCVVIGWTDNVGQKKQSTTVNEADAILWASATILARDLSGNPLSYYVGDCRGKKGTLPYNLFLIVEQLQ